MCTAFSEETRTGEDCKGGNEVRPVNKREGSQTRASSCWSGYGRTTPRYGPPMFAFQTVITCEHRGARTAPHCIGEKGGECL